MTKSEAREVLGIDSSDEVLKSALESLKECELKLLEYTKDKSEIARIKLWVRAINTLLKLKDYVEE